MRGKPHKVPYGSAFGRLQPLAAAAASMARASLISRTVSRPNHALSTSRRPANRHCSIRMMIQLFSIQCAFSHETKGLPEIGKRKRLLSFRLSSEGASHRARPDLRQAPPAKVRDHASISCLTVAFRVQICARIASHRLAEREHLFRKVRAAATDSLKTEARNGNRKRHRVEIAPLERYSTTSSRREDFSRARVTCGVKRRGSGGSRFADRSVQSRLQRVHGRRRRNARKDGVRLLRAEGNRHL